MDNSQTGLPTAAQTKLWDAGGTTVATGLVSRTGDTEGLGARLHWLVETGNKLTACTGAAELCTFLLEEFVRNMGAEGGSLFLCREGGLECMHTLDTDHVPASIPFPLRENSVFDIALKERRAVQAADISAKQEIVRSGWAGYRNGSLLVLPMCQHSGTVVGLISLHGKVGAFTQHDQELALIMASLSSEVLHALEVTSALRESEDRLKTIFDTVATGIVLIDPDTHLVTDINSTALRMLGLSRDDVIGHPCQDYFSSGRVLPCQALDNTEAGPGTEAILRTADGTCVPILQKVTRATLGGRRHLIESFVDISEQKRAEQECARLTTAVEQAAEILIITDAEGMILYANSAFEQTTGYTRGEVIGRPTSFLMDRNADKALWDEVREVIAGGKVWRGRLTNYRKDGTHYKAEAMVSPMRNAEGEVTSYISVSRDVTKEMRLESQLQQAQKMEAIGQLAAGVAHEINTPTQYIGDNIRFFQESFGDIVRLLRRYGELLAAVRDNQGYASLVAEIDALTEEGDLAFLLAESPAAIERALDGNRRVAEIVRAMKEFAHPGGEGMVLTDINHAIKNAVAVARNEWKYVADVTTDLADGLPLITCEPGGFNQVILNMIVNAAHAIRERLGAGTTGKGEIAMSTRPDGDHVEIRIRDTGTGIPKQIQGRIFEPFFTTKEVGKGTGQGLAIAYSVIVDKHHGTIHLESELGQGTTFIVRLPIRQEETEE